MNAWVIGVLNPSIIQDQSSDPLGYRVASNMTQHTTHNIGPFTHFMALCAITRFHMSAAGIKQRYHQCEIDAA